MRFNTTKTRAASLLLVLTSMSAGACGSVTSEEFGQTARDAVDVKPAAAAQGLMRAPSVPLTGAASELAGSDASQEQSAVGPLEVKSLTELGDFLIEEFAPRGSEDPDSIDGAPVESASGSTGSSGVGDDAGSDPSDAVVPDGSERSSNWWTYFAAPGDTVAAPGSLAPSTTEAPVELPETRPEAGATASPAPSVVPTPQTSVPVTQPPATLPPVTQAPATLPPVTQPPATLPPVAAAVAPATSRMSGSAIQESSLAELNGFRAENGLPALTLDAELTGYATSHANWMGGASNFSHSTQLGSLLRPGHSGAGENIARHNATTTPANEVVAEFEQSWEDSPSHRENMLGEWTEVGIGFILNDEGWWAVHVFRR